MGPNPYLWFLDAKQQLMDRNNKTLWVPDVTCRFEAELQVFKGTRPHVSFCACKTEWFAPEWQVYIGSNPHLCFCACKTAPLGTDLQVCMGPSPNLYFEHT